MKQKKWISWVIPIFLGIALTIGIAYGGATFSRIKTWSTGETLTASDLNAEFDNILNNFDPDGVDDASANAAAMQTTADPYPGGVESLPTDLSGELQRLRYVIRQQNMTSYWYIFPDIVSKTTTYTATANDRVILCDSSAGAWTLTLPAASGVTDKIYYIKKTDSSGNAITIDPNGTETIDGATTLSISVQYDAYAIVSDGSNWHAISEPDTDSAAALPKKYRSTYNGIAHDTDADHDIEIQTGEWRDASDTKNIVLSSVLTKQIDSNWTAGDDAGGFPSSLSLSANTTYHVFVIFNDDDSAVDGGYDTSLTATNLLADSGYERYRRVGSVITDASNNIIPCLFMGHWVRMKTPVLDVDVSTQDTTYVARTLTVPTGNKLIAFGNMYISTVAEIQIRPPNASDGTPSMTASPLGVVRHGSGQNPMTPWLCMTNTSGQVETASSAASTTIKMTTEGWYDAFED